MTHEEFKDLKPGDIVRNQASGGLSYIITSNYGGHCTAARTVNVTQPDEWDLMYRCILEAVNPK